MSEYNKIIVASSMLLEASTIFDGASSEMDFITSILLSGAVIGIIAPLLSELGGYPTHEILARIADTLDDNNEERHHPGMFRTVYNALKHAGNKRKTLKASDDLEFEANLAQEAEKMLYVAKSDFSNIYSHIHPRVKKQLPTSFTELIWNK